MKQKPIADSPFCDSDWIDWNTLPMEKRIEISSKISNARVARLKRAQEELAGVRIKARIPLELIDRVRNVAGMIEADVSEFVCAACRCYSRGQFRVPFADFNIVGTREASKPIWIRVPNGFDASAKNLRTAIVAALAHYEPLAARRSQYPVEGRDYILPGRNYTRIVKGRLT